MSRPAPKTFHVKSFGCQMNVYDGERMAEMLANEGMTTANSEADADLVVLNTCHIREKAVDKVYSDIGRLRREDGTRPMIAVAGCIAQAEGAEIPRRAHEVDIVVGPQAYHHLPSMIETVTQGKRAIDLDLPGLTKFSALPPRRKTGPTAFLTIQEGCDKFCTYCVVPYTRGAEISRSFEAIVDEARTLIDAGAKEITLLGQNVNAWALGHKGFHDLLAALDKLPGLKRLRYMTSHPNDMTQGLIEAHGTLETLMPFLHLPVQSGNDRILKAMNRSHSAASYRDIIDRVRKVRPDITLRLIEDVGYAMAYSFKYSPRPGTPAATMEGQIPPSVMDDRLQQLQALINQQQSAFNEASVGKRTSILLERKGKLAGQLIGKTPWLQSVHVMAGEHSIGDLVEVDLISAGANSLSGMMTEKELHVA
jgi:tRNA-2-methylthio-N6-dimethylallyladenosine synthase